MTNNPRVRVSEYRIVPQGFDESENYSKESFVIYVAWRGVNDNGDDTYAVIKGGRQCLSVDGQWDYEFIPSSRTEEWLSNHRFSEKDAIERALEVVDSISLNGGTFSDWENRIEKLKKEK